MKIYDVEDLDSLHGLVLEQPVSFFSFDNLYVVFFVLCLIIFFVSKLDL